jgi:nitroimidazol reductase NimA-like FMN-containing flavoprotein (pyridoxamine 5'-phosphate oxidase superfamily)
MELTELSPSESWALLATAPVGRVASVRGGLPAIVPVNICVADGAVWFRTGPGGLLDAAIAGDVLSVEADEVDRAWHRGWSVVVTGRAQVAADRPDVPVAAWAREDAEHVVRIDGAVVAGRRL